MSRKKETADQNKAVRFQTILKLVSEQNIGTQKELSDMLEQLGFNVTQATVSRDIRELRLIKTALGDGTFAYRSISASSRSHPVSSTFHTLFRASVTSINTALHQIVIRTQSGMASAVCAGLDNLAWDDVLGTIAGDDTILIIVNSEQNAKTLTAVLKGYL